MLKYKEQTSSNSEHSVPSHNPLLGPDESQLPKKSNLRRPRGGDLDVKGELIFTPEQTVYVRHFIARLLRIVCIREGITNRRYDELHSRFWDCYGGGPDKSASDRTSQKGNITKAIEPTTVTWKTFEKFVTMILRLDILDLSVTVRNENGDVRTYSASDPLTDINATPTDDDVTIV